MDKQLVENIVQQVITALGRQGSSAGVASEGSSTIQPIDRNPSRQTPEISTKKTFITADMLAQRLAGSNNGQVQLAANEFLTPGAQDLVANRRLKIRRKSDIPLLSPIKKADQPQTGPLENNPGSQAVPAGTIGFVLERPDGKVRNIINSLHREGLDMADYSLGDCWIINLRSLCEAIAAGSAVAGVAIMPYAADAIVLANKSKGIRAVQGTRVESVLAGLRHFGANLLVVEHAFSTYHEMRVMIRHFMIGQPAAGGANVLLEAVAKLEGA